MNSTDEDSTSLIVAIKRLPSPPVADAPLSTGDPIHPSHEAIIWATDAGPRYLVLLLL
jgi:hypothetical protein